MITVETRKIIALANIFDADTADVQPDKHNPNQFMYSGTCYYVWFADEFPQDYVGIGWKRGGFIITPKPEHLCWMQP